MRSGSVCRCACIPRLRGGGGGGGGGGNYGGGAARLHLLFQVSFECFDLLHFVDGLVVWRRISSGVSICTFVPVKQVN
jgi:hypothetical protein